MRGKAHVAGAQGHHAIGQLKPAQHLLGAGEHALVLVLALLRRSDGDELDLGELVLADHAARILARRPGFGAEARRAGSEAQGERVLVKDRFAHEIGQRHFGGRDEPKAFALRLRFWIGKKIGSCSRHF